MSSIYRALILALIACSSACGQVNIAKTFSLGDLAFVESSEPVTWICFDRAVSQEVSPKRDKPYRCYLGLQAVGTFRLAALSKDAERDVLAYYTITVVSGPHVDPVNPVDPVVPVPPTPIDVPNVMGVGQAVFAAAVVVGDKAACNKCASVFEDCAVGLERSSGTEAALEASAKVLASAVKDAMPGAKWEVSRKRIAEILNSNAQQAGGYGYRDWIKVYRECSAALKKAGI